jgi:hypothetical protein
MYDKNIRWFIKEVYIYSPLMHGIVNRKFINAQKVKSRTQTSK